MRDWKLRAPVEGSDGDLAFVIPLSALLLSKTLLSIKLEL